MKRYSLIAILLISVFLGKAQNIDSTANTQAIFDSLLVEGIREFHKDIQNSDFQKAVDALEKAVQLQPQNAKAHYYLGYAYSRLNSKEGSRLNKSQKQLCILASNEMQEVIRLDSTFGAEYILSPYSKITTEWGSLALNYINQNNLDSAKWAFNKGKQNGGFSDFFLQYYRIQLDQCSANAILFSYGDNNYFNLLYLQTIENYRTDISVIDMGLIFTPWYQTMLKNKNIIDFTPAKENEKGYYLVPWSDTIILIPIKNSNQNFSWSFEAKGSNPYYLFYGDIAFRSILSTNQFKRDIYFTYGFPKSAQYNLYYNFEDQIMLYKVNPFEKSTLDADSYNKLALKFLDIIPSYNANSYEEFVLMNSIRQSIMLRIYNDWSSPNNQDNARYLLKLLLKKLPSKKYPYSDKETEIYINSFKRIIIDEY
jgi:hypothetical protein